MTVSLKQSAPYFYVKSNVRCQFGLTCSPLLHVFPCFPEGGCTEARLQRLNHILYPCPPAYLGHRGRLLPSAPPGETPRLSRPSWRDFISAAWPGPPWGLLQVGCDQNKAASFQCGGAAGLLWAPHKQTASSFLFLHEAIKWLIVPPMSINWKL